MEQKQGFQKLKLIPVLIMLTMLSACGQGGSGSGAAGNSSSSSEGTDSGGCILLGSNLPSATLQAFTELCRLTNEQRAANNLPALTLSLAITNSAQAHAQDMVTRNFFSHVNPDGLDPFQRLSRDGVSFGAAGENIAAGHSTAASVLNAWMNSSGHRANILHPAFRKLGLGFAEGRWVQVFTD